MIFGKLRRVLQRGEHARLAVVRVVAHRPVEFAGRRQRPEPLARRLVAAARRGRGRIGAGARPPVVAPPRPVVGGPPTPFAPVPFGLPRRIFVRVRAAVALDLVHPDHAVVVRRHEREIAGRPHVDEAVRPHAGHAVLGHLRHLEVREHRQLAVEDRIESRVLRRLAAEGVEERLRLVQVVHDRRVPLQVPVEQRPHLTCE